MASQVASCKYIPGTEFNVDGFKFIRPETRHFFLTHFHGDHTIGLQRSFDRGVIFCSEVTARLLLQELGVSRTRVRSLAVGVPVVIDGVTVTPIPANHCPGAVMFLFAIPKDGAASGVQHVLHTGDMRWSEEMATNPPLSALRGALDIVMLDTTYCSPRWDFPPQREAIAAAADFVRAERKRVGGGRVLAVCKSYHIGKERFYFGVAQLLGSRLFCSPAKRATLKLLNLDPDWMALLCDQPEDADVHLLAQGETLRPGVLAKRLEAGGSPWVAIVGLRATGWSHAARGGPLREWREGGACVVGVPYSEHSSWTDLRSCIASMRPARVVPTVNASNPEASRRLVDCLADLMDLRQDRSRLYAYFGGKTHGPSCTPGSSTPKEGDGDAHELAAASEVARDRGTGGHWPGQDPEAQPAAASSDLAAPEPPAHVKREPPDSPKVVDLASIDTAEQARLWAEAQSAFKRRRLPGVLRQASLIRFLKSAYTSVCGDGAQQGGALCQGTRGRDTPREGAP